MLAGGLGAAAFAASAISSVPVGVGAVPLAVAAAGGAFALRTHRASENKTVTAIDTSLASALPEWQAGRRAALEGMVAELAGPAHTAHAFRCASLADLLAEQLAVVADEIPNLTLAAALHVLPVAFPPAEDAAYEGCDFQTSSLEAACAVLARTAPPEVAAIAAEANERWDGAGLPRRLSREEASIGARIIAAACLFDHASIRGLEEGLEAVRAASGSALDPVVAAELLHLFKQPWQLRIAA